MKKFILFFMVVLLIGCSTEPIKVGFTGDLTSDNSRLAIDARNAVQLRVRQINDSGGINGHEVTLIIKDDQSDPTVALKVHDEFKAEEVQFVIGHLTSNMAESALISEDETLLFVTPSMSTDILTGFDDYILRTAPVNSSQAIQLNHMFDARGVTDLMIVYDITNATYSEAVFKGVEDHFIENGHKVIGIPFNSKEDIVSDFSDSLKDKIGNDVLFITQASDTAFMIQDLKLVNMDLNTYSVSWSMTNDLITKGGKAVEGTIFVGLSTPETLTDNYVQFQNDFKDMFNYEPSFISMLAYDAFDVLLQGLEETKNHTPTDVKEAILEISEFNGLQETFRLDEMGDSDRLHMLFILEDGQFKPY